MNYYEILEITKNASVETIKAAYRVQAKRYHPDIYRGNQEFANEKMKEINNIREVLLDPIQRQHYDKQLEKSKFASGSSYNNYSTNEKKKEEAQCKKEKVYKSNSEGKKEEPPQNNDKEKTYSTDSEKEKESSYHSDNESYKKEKNYHTNYTKPDNSKKRKNGRSFINTYIFFIVCFIIFSSKLNEKPTNINTSFNKNPEINEITYLAEEEKNHDIIPIEVPPTGENGICNSKYMFYNDWLYYIHNETLCRVNEAGTTYEVLYEAKDDSINNFIIEDDKIYLGADHAIYSISLDGLKRKIITKEYSGHPLLLFNGWLFYDSLDGAMRINLTDTSQEIRMNGIITSFGYYASEKGIFYTYGFSAVDSLVYFKLDAVFDGFSHYTLISEQPNCGKSSVILEDNGWVYYFDNNGVWRIDIEGKNKQVVLSKKIVLGGWMNIQNNTLYCSSNNNGVFSVELDKLTHKKVSNSPIKKINIVGEWIYYTNESYGGQYGGSYESTWYKMKTDGTESQMVNSLGY